MQRGVTIHCDADDISHVDDVVCGPCCDNFELVERVGAVAAARSSRRSPPRPRTNLGEIDDSLVAALSESVALGSAAIALASHARMALFAYARLA
ncbi:unnamed protein product [Arctia plantaginis]|uniref:Uncharacterized protein n=1 Tax=Arctia plantaginis TaxID=874455 RepID=A0A8S0ZPR7_ARCPL|nr:unnamed protein product [Arctia plantaginis]